MSTKNKLKFKPNFSTIEWSLHGRPAVEIVLRHHLKKDAHVTGHIEFEYDKEDSFIVFENADDLLLFKLCPTSDEILKFITF